MNDFSTAGVATARQWLRKAELLVGDGAALDLSDFHFTFNITHTDSSTPNAGKIRIYNLSPGTVSQIRKEFTRVVLKAGYEGSFGTIFDGTLIEAASGHQDQTSSFLEIKAADGDLPYNFAVVNQSLKKGATVQDRIRAVMGSMAPMGTVAGYMSELPARPLARGRVMACMARDALDEICRSVGAVWTIQEGKLVIVSERSYVRDTVQILTDRTGVVGRPVQTEQGIKVKMLLNPDVKPGRMVYLDNDSIERYRYQTESEKANQGKHSGAGGGGKPARAVDGTSQRKLDEDGYYYVMVAEHKGDTQGQDWYTTITCLARDATLHPGEFPSPTADEAGPQGA